MTFIHPLLLGGLLLAGIPILLHLIMRQQPKHLFFPAMRFLLQKRKTNQRKLQLRHLLLLAMRILLIALMCLALARPRIFSDRFIPISADQPVAAVLLFDTSYSMEYASGRSRLEEAKQRGFDLLDVLPQNSRVAVVDTAQRGAEWLATPSLAREKIAALELRPANEPITNQLPLAYDLLVRLLQEEEISGALRPFIYIFSDRAQACWDQRPLENLQRLRDRVQPAVTSVFVDVGVDKPADLAIANLQFPRQMVPSNEPVVLRATVQATGGDYDTEIIFRIVDQAGEDRKAVKLSAGQSQVISFERRGLKPGVYQAEAVLAAADALPFDNIRYATFEVLGPRKVLTISDEPGGAYIWKLALTEGEMPFDCEVRSVAEANRLLPTELAEFKAICLLNVSRPEPELWKRLEQYVREGGGLAIIPGGDDVNKASYNDDATAQQLLPVRLERVIAAKPGEAVLWAEASYQDPVKTWFREWRQNPNIGFLKDPPRAVRYWEVTPYSKSAQVIVKYADDKERPALVERTFDRPTIRGRVVLLTIPLDDRRAGEEPRWHNYLQGLVPFYLALAKKTVGYLAGDAEEANFNYSSGQPIPVALPPKARFPTYTLQGPGLTGTNALVQREESANLLQLTKAVMPGHFTLFGNGKPLSSFSLNLPPDECQLAKVPVDQIEALFGPNAILAVDYKTSLSQALQSHWSQPVELLPGLLIFVLLLVAVECFVANRFYRKDGSDDKM